jgi:hypothetical protein
MKWGKGYKKGAKKGGKRDPQTRAFTVALFCTFFFPFPPELRVGPCFFFRFSTLFVLLIEKGGKKNRAKNEENGKKSAKKGVKKGGCEQP